MPEAWDFRKRAESLGYTPAAYAKYLISQHGNISAAAKASGFARWTLKRYLKLAGVELVSTQHTITRIIE